MSPMRSVFLLLIVFFVFSGCGPIYETGRSSRLKVEPGESVSFHRVEAGSRGEVFLDLANTGDGILSISSISLRGSDTLELGLHDTDFPIEVASGDRVSMSVIFEPRSDSLSGDGIIEIVSNDPERSHVNVSVLSQQGSGQIQVRPSREEGIIIGHVEVGAQSSREVIVYNSGDLPLTVHSIRFEGSDEFNLSGIDGGFSFPRVLGIAGSEILRLSLGFTPKDEGQESGRLIVESDDPFNPEYVVDVNANSTSPCLLVRPGLVEFKPAVSVGSEREVLVKLESCSEVGLVIEDVIADDSGGIFSHSLRGGGKSLGLGEYAELTVRYHPVREGTDITHFTILSNDPVRSSVKLDVLGIAMNNQCPVAVARGRVSSSSEWQKSISASPLDVLALDGALSHDLESEITEWRWSVRSRPADSTSAIESSGSSASFFVDLAGEYEICLEVTDGSGLLSCSSDCITVDARPKETIHIQLVWKTPDDKVIGDADGTDLDLHFMHVPSGRWGDRGNAQLKDGSDIFFLNREANWSVSGGHIERPQLDRDDKDGEGPENISLDNPNACRWYAIGVHYYNDYGFGPSYATVRVYISGKLRYERSNLGFERSAEFRETTLLLWDGSSARLYDVDNHYFNDDDWIGKAVLIDDRILESARATVPHCFSNP